MGLFDSLFGKRGPKFCERLWLTTERKLADLTVQLVDNRIRRYYPMVVFHFPATGEVLCRVLESGNIAFRVVRDFREIRAGDVREWKKSASALIVPSEILASSGGEVPRPKTSDPGRLPVGIHLVEHYPCAGRDETVLRLDDIWPMPIEFTCYTSLDEPWLRLFIGRWAQGLLGRMGLDEDGCMGSDSGMAKGIRRAQLKIARKVRQEQPCRSCEEWLLKNLPEQTM